MKLKISSHYIVKEPEGDCWVTQCGEVIPIAKMRTSHIFYSLRMIFNHSVPPVKQIPGCKRYNGPQNWDIRIKTQYVKLFLEELSKRKDIQPFMLEQLEQMRSAVAQRKLLT